MRLDVSALTVDELRRRLGSDQGASPALLARLRGDRRAGVRRLAAILQERRDAYLKERRRVSALLRLERGLWRSGLRYVAGVDEAGVGPLAGPVVAAAVIFPPEAFIPGLNDSKLLAEDQRLALAEAVRGQALAWAVGVAEVEEIDRLNVYWAGLLAMKRAVEALTVRPERLLVDARRIPEVDIPQNCLVSGDRRHFSIAAASILAKTRRDQIMCELDRRFPAYGFGRHKGYSTPEHQRAIRKNGPSPVHRTSYEFVQELCGSGSSDYYRLKDLLKESRSAEELARFRRRLAASRVTAREQRKLKALLSRKAVQLPRPRQMAFPGDLP